MDGGYGQGEPRPFGEGGHTHVILEQLADAIHSSASGGTAHLTAGHTSIRKIYDQDHREAWCAICERDVRHTKNCDLCHFTIGEPGTHLFERSEGECELIEEQQ